MKQDKSDKIIQKAEKRAKKAAQQVERASQKADKARQHQAELSQKKASKAVDRANKKAAKQTKKAEAIQRKAQQAAKKAEERKAKAVAKAADSALGASGDGEGLEEGAAPKKKSKKKLLFAAVPVLAVAVGVGVFFFLRGGGEKEEAPPEPIPAPLEYALKERSITALPVWGENVVVYHEELEPEPPEEEEETDNASALKNGGAKESEPEPEPEAEEEVFLRPLYRYEGLQDPGKLISAYMTLMTTQDAGFSTVDEELTRIDPPNLEGRSSGSVLLARNVPATEESEAGVQSLLLSWNGSDCSVLLDMPKGSVKDPPAPAPEGGHQVVTRGIEDLKALAPSKLGLLGESMEDYELMIQEGSVRIANSSCTRVNVYDSNQQIAGSFFLSRDGKLYKLDEETNKVAELDWE